MYGLTLAFFKLVWCTGILIEDCFRTMKDMVGKIEGPAGHVNTVLTMAMKGRNEDFTHGFVVTFDTPESRDIYFTPSYTRRSKGFRGAKSERVIVFDINIPSKQHI